MALQKLLNAMLAVAQATTSARGPAELATSAETITGTDTDRAVTPAAISARNVACRVHKNGTTQGSVPGSSTWTKVTFSTAGGGGSAWFDDANDRIVAPAAGAYMAVGRVYHFTNITDATEYQAAIYVNGSAVVTGIVRSSANLGAAVQVSDVLTLAANDYVELYVARGDSNSGDISGAAALCHLTLAKI